MATDEPFSRLISRNLRRRRDGVSGVGHLAPIYLAAVLEYVASEILDLAGNAARDNENQRITPLHVQLAIRNDPELNRLLGGHEIPMVIAAPARRDPLQQWMAQCPDREAFHRLYQKKSIE
jgi:hypothetical protein